MPTLLTNYPGVYIEEIPSGTHTITGVATSITAFIGRTAKGPVNEPIVINSFADFERIFGGLWADSTLGFAVNDFYNNGGMQAVIVRVTASNAIPANIIVPTSSTEEVLTLQAVDPGAWGNSLKVSIDWNVLSGRYGLPAEQLFNMTVTDTGTGTVESFNNLCIDSTKAGFITNVLLNQSNLVRALQVSDTLLPLPTFSLNLRTSTTAAYPGDYLVLAVTDTNIDQLEATVSAGTNASTFKIILDGTYKNGASVKETHDNLTLGTVAGDMSSTSHLVKVAATLPVNNPLFEVTTISNATAGVTGTDGNYLTEFDVIGSQANKTGLYALEKTDLFNILCIPPYQTPDVTQTVDSSVIQTAISYCENRRAFFIIDAPDNWTSVSAAVNGVGSVSQTSGNAAVFFPRIQAPNPLNDYQLQEFVPCGMIAGTMAAIDAQRGVWKAPAGLEASLVGVTKFSVSLTDSEIGQLNPLGVNCLRVAPASGPVIWGSRTRLGDDRLASEWKYIPVRRLALYLEESLYRNTQWAVFEPNDEPLWSQLRLNISSFMNTLFRQGAFQGKTTQEAYFVKCDSTTTTQTDINNGIVNIIVGFAALEPAEFVVIQIQQIAGQTQ